jgi:hypothetical protein
MDQQMGLTEFFAMEAGDYVERLDALVSPPSQPDADELVRLTRALRGSALMAKQADIALAAAAFEHFARDVKDRRRHWDDVTKQAAVHAVDEFKILIRQVGSWTDLESERAIRLARGLDPEGTFTEPATRDRVQTLDAGTRAFIGREGAAVGSALDRAAKSLQQDPDDHDSLQRVITIMQPLRGLSILSELPPMPELLDGIQRAISEVISGRQPAERAPLVLNSAAKALARAAKEIATEGQAEPESPDMQDFVAGLRGLVEEDAAVVPIESLNFDDGRSHIAEQDATPARRRVLGQLELVSHGEHLRQAADELDRAWSRTQLELRAQALVTTFRALSAASGSSVHDAVAHFAVAAREAVVRGVPLEQSQEFVTTLRLAGSTLVETGREDEHALAHQLTDLASELDNLPGRGTPPATVSAVSAPAPPAPEPPAVAREPQGLEAPVLEAPADTAAAAEETPDLVGSWARYERYVETLGLGEPALDELLAGPPADPGPPGQATAMEVAVPAPVEQLVVPIAELCYSGRAALGRALELRDQVRAAIAAGPDGAGVQDLVEEILDLVELGTKDEQ